MDVAAAKLRVLKALKRRPIAELPQGGRKETIRAHMDRISSEIDHWMSRNQYFHEADQDYMRFLIPEGQRVLELGCGAGQLLAALNPSVGVGVDLSEGMIRKARATYPHLNFVLGDVEEASVLEGLTGPFDAIVLSDTIGQLQDVQATLAQLHSLCHRDTRIVIAYHSWLWRPALNLAEELGLKKPTVEVNWMRSEDIQNFLMLSGFETIKQEWRQLIPRRLGGLGHALNRTVAAWPGLSRACVRQYVVARSLVHAGLDNPSVTVLIPCRNERGNIENAIRRMPQFCDDLEILFVEGNSQDDTYEEVLRVKEAYPHLDIKAMQQDGVGKGDAVRKGFAHARGEVLMILDADLTVPPEDLPKFYEAIVSGRGEYINGSRLVYPMERDAMRFLNHMGNAGFSHVFSWLLNQRITDTLCGTKVLTKDHYERLVAQRDYFGDFDPFGDFDLIFGSAKLNLKMIDVPIRYAARTYGSTQISRFRHGWLLVRMVGFAYPKLKGC